MNMSRRVHYFLIGCLVALGLATFGGTYFASTLLATQSKRLTALKLESAVLDRQQTDLNKAKKEIEKYEPLQKIAQAIVPQDKDQAQSVREIVKIAAKNRIQLSDISFPASTLGQSGASRSTSSSQLTQLKPLPGIPGVYNLEITIQQDKNSPVAYSNFISFLTDLENNRRTAQVSSINLEPSPEDSAKLTFTLVVQEYIKPWSYQA